MEWKTSPAPVAYEEAVAFMEARVQQIQAGTADELVWLLEHPALYTAGSSAKEADLIDTLGFPVYKTGRGGQYTYHGPGQRIAYVMLDLKKRTPDIRQFVKQLEQWIITTLNVFNVKGEVRDGRVGVWVELPHNGKSTQLVIPAQAGISLSTINGTENKDSRLRGNDNTLSEAKIAALGIRIRQWVTYHGISINVNPDLSHYRGIIPCGISEHGITSLAALGVQTSMDKVDAELKKAFQDIFAPAK